MSFARTMHVLRKDLRLGPRSPIFLYALVFPILATVLVQMVFGSLFEPVPRLGIVDEGHSAITQAALGLDDIEARTLASEDALRRELEGNDLDAGLVLPDGFDDDLRNGLEPRLQIHVAGESLAKNRLILAVVVADLVRGLLPETAEISVVTQQVGDGDALPLSDRLLPFLVMFAVLIAGVFVPAASLVEEKEKRTLEALLVAPTRIGEVLGAKGALGFILAMAAGLSTLALNRAFGSSPGTLVVILVVATLMVVEVGLILGCLARDSNALLSVIKTGNLVLLAPALFFIWPDLPSWVAKLLPTYYFLHPLFEVAVKNADLSDVWRELALALVLSAVLVPLVRLTGRRMAQRLAAA